MSLKILSYPQPQIPFEGDLPFCFNIVSLLKRGLELSSNVSARCPCKVGKMEWHWAVGILKICGLWLSFCFAYCWLKINCQLWQSRSSCIY